jgi:hypothetical protein
MMQQLRSEMAFHCDRCIQQASSVSSALFLALDRTVLQPVQAVLNHKHDDQMRYAQPEGTALTAAVERAKLLSTV